MSEHGGKRPGAGRKEGQLNQSTLEAMEVKRHYLQRVMNKADQLFNAQYSSAVGLQMLFVIPVDSEGKRRKPEMVTDPDIIAAFLDEHGETGSGKLDGNDEYYFITTKIPDTKAIQDMLDRAFGKAAQSLDVTTGGDKLTNPLSGLSTEELRKLANQ